MNLQEQYAELLRKYRDGEITSTEYDIQVMALAAEQGLPAEIE